MTARRRVAAEAPEPAATAAVLLLAAGLLASQGPCWVSAPRLQAAAAPEAVAAAQAQVPAAAQPVPGLTLARLLGCLLVLRLDWMAPLWSQVTAARHRPRAARQASQRWQTRVAPGPATVPALAPARRRLSAAAWLAALPMGPPGWRMAAVWAAGRQLLLRVPPWGLLLGPPSKRASAAAATVSFALRGQGGGG